MFEETVVIDGRGHLMGRLAAVIAKELLNGQHITVVRTEEINISGSRTWRCPCSERAVCFYRRGLCVVQRRSLGREGTAAARGRVHLPTAVGMTTTPCLALSWPLHGPHVLPVPLSHLGLHVAVLLLEKLAARCHRQPCVGCAACRVGVCALDARAVTPAVTAQSHLPCSLAVFRNQLKYAEFKKKRTCTNPRRGPFHQRSPARMLFRVLRGMIPHKTPRGAAALARFKAFEGIPHPYDKVKRKVVPAALRVTRLK